MTELPLLVVLLGPTASGKTALSLVLAEKFNGEIVSCDSVAVYRDFEIGTAKPSAEERARVPHHCIDIISPDHEYSAGDYQRDARAAIHEITARGRMPIVTGGTGLYLRALLEGLFAGPRRSEPLRARLKRSGMRYKSGWLSRVLEKLDPVAASRIHPNDTPKLIRAIEVSLEARRPITEAWSAGAEPLTGYRVLRIGLAPERKALYARIDARARAMFERGLVEETRRLMEKYGGERKIFDALGYRQAKLLLAGELTEAQATEAAQRGHRNYAKRQLTWFRREPEVRWLAGSGDDAEIQQATLDTVGTSLPVFS
ncbi:MAG: tRNA (adenosine(37)-N6)-dimethylallyltransferase MiaA, partial [Acidobacteriaceae bacterium]